MNKKNLFVIASPLQFLNAIEAMKAFETKNNILLLMYDTKMNNIDAQQKKDLIVKNDWEKIIEYDLGTVKKNIRLFSQVKLIKRLKEFKYNYIISGEEGTFNRILFANLISNSIYLVDDGTATILTYLKEKDNYYSKLPFTKRLKYIRYMLFGLKYINKNKIIFFTTFNIESTENIKVVKHNFNYLKSKIEKENKCSNIYFLGQSLVSAGYLEQKSYIEYIEKVISYYSNKNIIYIPHRSEIINKDYNKFINERFQIIESVGPIETTFINNKIYPQIIISFFSSALFTLEKIFPDSNILSIEIDKEAVALDKINIIDKCYKSFDNTNISIISLNNKSV